MKKFENLIWWIFFGIGMIFVVIGIFISLYVFNYENKIDTTGVITEINTYRGRDNEKKYDVQVAYEVKGKEYESSLNVYSSSFYEGKEIDIYYDKNNPNKIGVKSLDFVFLIFPGIGIIFALIGGIGLIVKYNKKKISKKLKEHGDLIYADYVQTAINTTYRVNGRHPYNIICEWDNPEDGKKYILKSQNIWFNPSSIIEQKNIKSFPVYINLNNKKQYVIDTEIIEENVIDLT